MSQLYGHICALDEECKRLCVLLSECLDKERRALVEFDMDEIPQMTLQKESLVNSLVRKRKEITELICFRYGIQSISELGQRLNERDRADWEFREANWTSVWQQTLEACQRNQTFLEHSLKNLSLLADNLKNALGAHTVYSAGGKAKENYAPGRVVEKKL